MNQPCWKHQLLVHELDCNTSTDPKSGRVSTSTVEGPGPHPNTHKTHVSDAGLVLEVGSELTLPFHIFL